MSNTIKRTCLMMRKVYAQFIILSLFALLLCLSGRASAEVLELKWLDLVPESEKVTPPVMAGELKYGVPDTRPEPGAIRPELNGKQVRLPGFIIPLEGDAKQVSEFLLVPYYGSCIHMPPPPPNQIIHVVFSQGAPDVNLWDVVYVEGKLLTQQNVVGSVEAGYHIIGSRITPYQ